MSNRYNTYQKIDYVGLPIDAYAQAAGSLEQENLLKLQESKSIYDGMQDVEASYNPDRQLKANLLENIQGQIAGISNKNLKGNDVLLQLNKIVGNRDVIDKLANIKANTINYKAALAAEKKYKDEYGNDINIQPGIDQRDAYNQLGADGFKSGMMDGYAPGKFVDVTGEVAKGLDKMKANGWKQDRITGKWIIKEGDEGVSTERLLESAGIMLNDLKYAEQLKSLAYYNLRPYGGNSDPKKAIRTYNDIHAKGLNEQIGKIVSNLSELATLQKNADPNNKDAKKRPEYYQKLIEQGNQALSDLGSQRDAYFKDESGDLFGKDMLTSISQQAAAPFAWNKHEKTVEVNAYGLANHKSALAFGNAWELFKRKEAAKTAKEKTEKEKDEISLPNPTMTSIIAGTNPNGAPRTVSGFVIDEKGGFDPSNIKSTVLALVNNLKEGKGPNNERIDLGGSKNSEVLSKEIKDGTAKIIYSIATDELSIQSPTKGIVRIRSDNETGNEFKNARSVYDMAAGTIKEVQLSLNGIDVPRFSDGTPSGVIVNKVSQHDAKFYAPQTQPIPIRSTLEDINPQNDVYARVKLEKELRKQLQAKGYTGKALNDEVKKLGNQILDEPAAPSLALLNQGLGVNLTRQAVSNFNLPGIYAIDAGGNVIEDKGQPIENARFIQVTGDADDKNQTIRVIHPVNATQSQIDAVQIQYATRPGGTFQSIKKKPVVKKVTQVTESSDLIEEDN